MARPFAVFDIDGTLIRWQLYHAVADAMVKEGYIDASEYQKIKDARMRWKTRAGKTTFKDYEKKLIPIHNQALSMLTMEQFDKVANDVFREYKDQVYTYTRDLIKQLKAKGYTLLAISGSQSEIVGKIAAYYGFEAFVGTEYLRSGDRYSGKSIFHAADKRLVLERLISEHKLSLAGSIAVGDSTSDIPMLEIVNRPIAFNPEGELLARAKAKGWEIVLERKNVIYQLKKQNGRYILVQAN